MVTMTILAFVGVCFLMTGAGYMLAVTRMSPETNIKPGLGLTAAGFLMLGVSNANQPIIFIPIAAVGIVLVAMALGVIVIKRETIEKPEEDDPDNQEEGK